jgi:hypothetical protein
MTAILREVPGLATRIGGVRKIEPFLTLGGLEFAREHVAGAS